MASFAPSFPEIQRLLTTLTKEVKTLLSTNLVGIYLFGSLTYDDFQPGRSDIDVVVIVREPLNSEDFEKLKKIHEKIAHQFTIWGKRIEISYTPLEFFKETLPPKQPRPYHGFGEGNFYQAQYGNEWIINNYLLYKYGIALTGPEFRSIVHPIDIREVQKACVKDLFTEWEPKLRESEWLNNPHYQSYLVLNLCRILNTVMNGRVESKTISAEWVKKTFPQWEELMTLANEWKYGTAMNQGEQTLDFLQFVIEQVQKTPLYREINA